MSIKHNKYTDLLEHCNLDKQVLSRGRYIIPTFGVVKPGTRLTPHELGAVESACVERKSVELKDPRSGIRNSVSRINTAYRLKKGNSSQQIICHNSCRLRSVHLICSSMSKRMCEYWVRENVYIEVYGYKASDAFDNHPMACQIRSILSGFKVKTVSPGTSRPIQPLKQNTVTKQEAPPKDPSSSIIADVDLTAEEYNQIKETCSYLTSKLDAIENISLDFLESTWNDVLDTMFSTNRSPSELAGTVTLSLVPHKYKDQNPRDGFGCRQTSQMQGLLLSEHELNKLLYS